MNTTGSTETTALTLEDIAGHTDMWYQQTTLARASAAEEYLKVTNNRQQ